jgi:hypothetical protein
LTGHVPFAKYIYIYMEDESVEYLINFDLLLIGQKANSARTV